MGCDNISYDNRETCTTLIPSSCIPYVGYISDTIKDDIPCKPNVNDIIKRLQEVIDGIKTSLGDNKLLDKKCLTFTALTVTQQQLNQLFIDQICQIKTDLAALNLTVDPTTLMLAVNLLCLTTPGCPVQTEYSLQEIIEKLITAYCSLLTRVQNIETFLNI